MLGEKWTLLVLREAMYGLRRFDDFARALQCGRGVLSARLKTLTQAGVLERKDYSESGRRTRSEYHLTAKGRDLYPAILALSQWSDRWAPPENGPAAVVFGRKTSGPVTVVMTSQRNPESLTMDDIVIRPGPSTRRVSR